MIQERKRMHFAKKRIRTINEWKFEKEGQKSGHISASPTHREIDLRIDVQYLGLSERSMSHAFVRFFI